MEKTPELLCYIYKNVKMGSDAILTLLPKVQDEKFKYQLTDQLNGYEKFASEAEYQLTPLGIDPHEDSFIKKLGAKLGIQMNTLTNTTVSHMAEMMIQGTVMGITALKKSLGELSPEAHEDIRALAEAFLKMEEEFERIWKERL